MLYNKVGYRSYGVAATSAQLRMRMTDLRSMLVTYLVGLSTVTSCLVRGAKKSSHKRTKEGRQGCRLVGIQKPSIPTFDSSVVLMKLGTASPFE